MTRSTRITIPACPHHMIQRGNNINNGWIHRFLKENGRKSDKQRNAVA
jgi:hypothetical protein